MLGLMQDWPLTVDKIIDHARNWHGHREVVTRSVEGPIVRTTYGQIHERARRLSNEFSIDTSPGAGTRVRFTLTDPAFSAGSAVVKLWLRDASGRGGPVVHRGPFVGCGAGCIQYNVSGLPSVTLKLRFASRRDSPRPIEGQRGARDHERGEVCRAGSGQNSRSISPEGLRLGSA